MHDIRTIRADGAAFDAALARRFLAPMSETLLKLDAERRDAVAFVQAAQERRNAISRQIGELKRRGEATDELEAEVAALRGDLLDATKARAATLDEELQTALAAIPNLLDPDVPDGPDEASNVVLKQVGEPRPLGFPARQHFELGEALGMMDFETAARIAGSRFTILRGPLARLERALGQFMLDLHTSEHGYTEIAVPTLVNDAAMFGTNQLPKFAEDSFRTTDGRWLIATSEIPLTNMAAGQILAERQLPIRVTALTDCFRSEAGAAGRDTRGMLRQHQFRKVELVSIAHPDHSEAEQQRMTGCAERVLELLELPYRRVLLAAGDTGFGAARTFDLEVWLPGQAAWREISSCSNTRAFQARRMNARFRTADGKTVAHVHTLNGSGVAVGRALVAVMENYQQADGGIAIPAVLRPWMAGLERISPK
ncbi:MAG TPA: serine--tRNA ligase [Acetobacteraceae bacterium]|nr:serine--tRNA ligase [Acetobacteraceae bacterium]